MTTENIEQIRTEIIECIKNYPGQAYPIREIDAILGREFTRQEQYASTKAEEVKKEEMKKAFHAGKAKGWNSINNPDFDEWYTQYKKGK